MLAWFEQNPKPESMQVSIEREFIFPNSKQANRGQIMSGTDDTNSGTRFVRGCTCDMLVPLYMLKLSAVAYFYRHKEAYSDWTTARFTFFIRVDYTVTIPALSYLGIQQVAEL